MSKTTYSDMYCTKCGNKNIPIWRKLEHEREPGHLKRMWCNYCQEEVNMVEVREFGTKYTKDDFIWEYTNGNFDKNGNRILSFGEFRDRMHNEERLYGRNIDSNDRTTWIG